MTERTQVSLFSGAARMLQVVTTCRAEGRESEIDPELLSECMVKLNSLKGARGQPRYADGTNLQGPSLYLEITTELARISGLKSLSSDDRYKMFEKHMTTIDLVMEDASTVRDEDMQAASIFLNCIALGLERYIHAVRAFGRQTGKY